MKRALLLIVAAVTAAAVMASCSGGDSGGDDAPAADTATLAPGETPPPPPPAAPGEIVVPAIRAEEGLTTIQIAQKLAPSIVRVQVGVDSIDVFGRIIPQEGVGTGVIIDAAGHIVTNNHVVTAGDGVVTSGEITVTMSDQRTLPATVVGHDQATDLAVIKIDSPGLVAAPFADPSTLQVGQEVVAIGFALDLEGDPTVTRGVISATNRTIEEQPFTIPDAIQTDASINPGNSGGPLVNARGEIVGINTAGIRGAENLGFAINVALVEPTVRELIEKGEIERAYLGIGSVDLTEIIARNFDIPVDKGIVVTVVAAGTPADAAGLVRNDVIVTVDGVAIENNGQLLAILAERRPGQAIALEYYRGPEKRSASAILVARPE
jgi:serine protease Do